VVYAERRGGKEEKAGTHSISDLLKGLQLARGGGWDRGGAVQIRVRTKAKKDESKQRAPFSKCV